MDSLALLEPVRALRASGSVGNSEVSLEDTFLCLRGVVTAADEDVQVGAFSVFVVTRCAGSAWVCGRHIRNIARQRSH